MNTKNALIIEFKSLDQMKEEVLRAIRTRVPNIQPKNVLYFDTWASFRGFMTLQKLEILTLIATAKPKSIYELTKLLDRSLSAVQKDCDVLQRIGFIKFIKQKGGRGKITPKLKFNYQKIIVKLPKHPYELTFKSAA